MWQALWLAGVSGGCTGFLVWQLLHHAWRWSRFREIRRGFQRLEADSTFVPAGYRRRF